jgi:hypothetical protein
MRPPVRTLAAVLGTLTLAVAFLAPCLCLAMMAPRSGEHGCCDETPSLQAADGCCVFTSTESATGATTGVPTVPSTSAERTVVVPAGTVPPAEGIAPHPLPVSFSPILRI